MRVESLFRIVARATAAALVAVIHGSVHASELSPVNLAELTRRAVAIAMVRVDRMVLIHGWPVAMGVVLRPIKGLKTSQRIAMPAYTNWIGVDVTDIRENEVAIFFLQQWNSEHATRDVGVLGPAMDIGKAFSKLHQNVPFLKVAHSGAGKMPVAFARNQPFVRVHRWTYRSFYGDPTSRFVPLPGTVPFIPCRDRNGKAVVRSYGVERIEEGVTPLDGVEAVLYQWIPRPPDTPNPRFLTRYEP